MVLHSYMIPSLIRKPKQGDWDISRLGPGLHLRRAPPTAPPHTHTYCVLLFNFFQWWTSIQLYNDRDLTDGFCLLQFTQRLWWGGPMWPLLEQFQKDLWAVAKVLCKEKWMETESRDSKEEQLFWKSGSGAYWENSWRGQGGQWKVQCHAQCHLNPALCSYPHPRSGRFTQVCKLRMRTERETELWASQTGDHNQISVQQKAGENEDRNTSRGWVLEEWKSEIPSFKARSALGFHQSLVWW